MLPTSSSTHLVGRNARSATARINGSRFLPEVCGAAARGSGSAKPTPRPGQRPTRNRCNCARTGVRRADRAVVCSARVERVENEELRDHRRASRRRWRWRPAAAAQRQDAQRAAAASSRWRSARRRFPASRRLAQRTHLVIAVRNAGAQDDPRRRGDDLQRHLRLPGAQGRGLERAGVRRQHQPARTWPARRGRCGSSTAAPGALRLQLPDGGPGAAVTAYANTWALGALEAGADGALRLGGDGRHGRASTSSPGRSPPGSTARPRRCCADGSSPHGTFKVHIEHRAGADLRQQQRAGRQRA